MQMTEWLAMQVRRAGGIEDFAAGIDVDPTTIRRWLRGHLVPNAAHIEALAEFTSTDMGVLAVAAQAARLTHPRKPLAHAMPVAPLALPRAS